MAESKFIINYKVLILAFVVVMLIAYYSALPFASFFDDFAALIMLLVTIVGLLRRRKLDSFDAKVITLLALLMVLGLASSLIYGIQNNSLFWANDAFSFLRIYMVYFGTVVLLRGCSKNTIMSAKILSKFSKWFIVFAFIFAILNYMGIVNMYNSMRFGIKSYSFFFSSPSQLGIVIGVSLAFIIMSNERSKIIEMLGFLVLVMTTKGTSLIILAVYLLLNFFAKRKIKWWHIGVVAVVLFFVLQFQIESYIIDQNAPRAILLIYGFRTALTFFPLGAGFATYGSNMAAVHYSPLYHEYGFAARKAFTFFEAEDGTTITYLNDNYLAMVLGEYGFIGTVLQISIMYLFGKRILSAGRRDSDSRNIILALFICLCGASIMTGSIKNATGELIFILLGLYFSQNFDTRFNPVIRLK